jgi:hypothetical protein
MSEHVFQKAIEDAKAILEQKEAEVRKLKRTINGMAEMAGLEPIYPDEEPKPAALNRRNAPIRPDEFFGRPPTTAAREFLEKVAEPRDAEDILAALTEGGFDFQAQNWKDEKLRLKNLAISLSKNSQIFVRLPSGPFALVKWYPELKAKAKPRTNDASEKSEPRNAKPIEEGTLEVVDLNEPIEDDEDEPERNESDSGETDAK